MTSWAVATRWECRYLTVADPMHHCSDPAGYGSKPHTAYRQPKAMRAWQSRNRSSQQAPVGTSHTVDEPSNPSAGYSCTEPVRSDSASRLNARYSRTVHGPPPVVHAFAVLSDPLYGDAA